MFLDNPFFLRETRQHARRPLPLQLGLLGLTGAFAFVLFMEQYLWNRFGRGNDPPDALIGFMVFPHFLVCAAAGAYGADRIFGEEHRRSTLEALFLIPISHGKWLAQRLAWPLYLVVTAWLTGVPAYLLAALLRIGSPDFNLQLSLIALSGGLVAMTLAMLLPPDYRERMRAARMAAGGRKRKVDVDLAFTWGIFSGLGILFQFSMISQIWRLRGPVSFYGTRLEIAPLLGAIALAVVGAAVAVSMATVSREDRWVRWSQRVRIGAVGVLYYGVSGLILGALWYRISFWVQWGVPILFPLAVWLLLRNQSRPKEDRLSVNEVLWAEQRWADPMVTRDLRSFTRFSSIRKWIGTEFLSLVGIYAVLVYLFVWKGGESLGSVTQGALGFGAIFGSMILIAEISARPFAMWTKERTSSTLTLLFLVPRPSGELLRGRLVSALFYCLSAHLPLVLLCVAGLAWHIQNAQWAIAAALLIFSPIAGLFFVVLGCTVQPQTAPPWQWYREDWLEAGLAVLQIILLVIDVVAIAQAVSHPSVMAWPMAAFLFLLNAWIVYGCYRIRVRQFEALRTGDRILNER